MNWAELDFDKPVLTQITRGDHHYPLFNLVAPFTHVVLPVREYEVLRRRLADALNEVEELRDEMRVADERAGL